MSYLPQEVSSQPVGACLISQQTGVSISAGTQIPHTSASQWLGSTHSNITISSGQITLPSGYYYYLEGTIQTYFTGSDPSQLAEAYFSWYDVGTGLAVGSQGRNGRDFAGSDASLTAADEKAIYLCDATAGAVTLEMKVISTSIFDEANSLATQYVYAGLGRTVLVQLAS
jgi:hypothetical protein